jgi:hypothetical protein
MANSNFVVQNGLQAGAAIIFAGNGDVITSGNLTTTGSGSISSANGFGGLNPNQIYQGTSNVTVNTTSVTVGIGGAANVATFNSAGLTINGQLTVTGTETINNIEYATTINATNLYASTIGNTGATLTGTIQTAAQTNITSVGTLTGLTVSGAIVPNANVTVNLGSSSAWFNNIYGTAIHAQYADLAENYVGDKTYSPGTVMMFGGSAEVTVADADTTAVAGVVSTNPATLMNGSLTGPNVVPVAFTGRVPTMIIGPVKKGDLMVSAGFGYAKTNNSPSIGQVIGKALQDFPINGKGVIEVVVGRF